MNATVYTIFREYLEQTDQDRPASATLTLADVLQTALDAPAVLPSADPSLPMTVPEVAKFLRVRPDKVLSWIRSGRLRGYNVAEREKGRPKYRVNPSDLDAFSRLREPVQPVPAGRPAGSRSLPKKVLFLVPAG